jgi:DNA-binding transcriptional LysR family regulator
MLNSEELLLIHAISTHRRLDLAARALGASHSTLFRKLLVLENRIGGALFVKAKGEYRATVLGQVCCQSAQTWLQQQQLLDNALQSHLQGRQQRLRITTTEDVAMFWLPRCIERLKQTHGDLTVDVWVDERELDLASAEADVAIRPTRRPPEGWVGLDLGALEMAVYGNASIAKRWHAQSPREPMTWITRHPESGAAADRNWTDANAHTPSVRFNRASAFFEAARVGLGAALLPCFVGDAMLLTCLEEVRLGKEPAKLWLLTHPDRRRDTRVRALFAAARFSGKLVKKNRPNLENCSISV